MRIISDSYFHKKTKTPLICPFSMMNKKLRNLLNFKNKLIYDFGFQVDKKKDLQIEKNFLKFEQPLAVAYAVGIGISGRAKKIYLAGFDGFDKNDPRNDDTYLFFKKLKNYKNKTSINFLTKTSYKIRLS